MKITGAQVDLASQSTIRTVTGHPEQRDARLSYVPGLDGLRAIAVLAVLLYHADLPVWGGFLGVETFFVISGFLITALLLGEWRQQGRISITAFWLRRARRLLPALFLMLAGTLLYTVVLLPRETAEVRGDALAALAYVMNWHLVFSQQSYFDAALRPPLLQHLWSLAVEEQFYLLWPLLFSAGMRYLRAAGFLLATLATVVGSVALMALLYQPGADPSRIYYGTDTRAAGLLVGAALAMIWTPGRAPAATSRDVGLVLDGAAVLAIGGLIAAYSSLHEQHPLLYRGGFFLVALCTATVIMAVTHPRARLVQGVLAWQPFRWIGLRSYGIYLWHWPIFMVTRPYLDVPLEGWPLLVLRLAIVVGLAALSYRYVELPVRHGAIQRAWRVLWERRSPASMSRNEQWMERRWLRLPLVFVLLLASVIWSAQIDTPRAAAPSSPSPPATASSVAIHVPVPTIMVALPAPSPTTAATLTPTTTPTAIPPTSTASRATDVPAIGTATATPDISLAAADPTASPDMSPTAPEPTAPPATPSPAVSPTPVEPAPLDPALAAELQRLLDDTVSDGFVPGAVLSISIPGYLPWSGASGVADYRSNLPMAPDTLVHLASLTKMFTAVVVLQLAEEGRLDLDAPIGTWLPDIVQLAETTTPRHLLSHTSGIYDYLEDRRFFVPAYRNPDRAWTPDELVAMADQFGPAFRPGARWQYSSTNYVLLGILVEQVTGRTLAEEMRRRIFDPLALTHTSFAPHEALQGRLAQGYIDESDRADVSMTFVFGTGNIISTADDLRRFVESLFGGRLLSAASLQMMAAVVDTGGAYAMPELQYGLGLMGARLNVGPRPDGAERPDAISTVLGHIGGIAGFRAAAWWVPESGITIALGLNQADIDPNLLARDVLEAILTWQGR